MARKILILLISLATLTSVAMARVIRVPDDQPTIQAGIGAAEEGDQVLVAPGIYTGDGNRDIDFQGKAIEVASDSGPGMTIIDCQGSESDPHRGFYFQHGEGRGSILRGFTIMNGLVYGVGKAGAGGAIFFTQASSPFIVGNIIVNNRANEWGGGVFCDIDTEPLIGWNVFTSNAASVGGAISCYEGSSPIIVSNTFTSNWADVRGGAFFCECDSTPVIFNCIFWGDSSGDIGPEIFVYGACEVPITYSDVQGGWEGEGNIDADPMFAVPEHRDYRLLWGSPCIDAGSPDSSDPDGTPSEMGAFYFDQFEPLKIYLTPDTTIISRTETLGVTYTLINILPNSQTFYLQSDVFLPDGEPYPGNPIIGPMKVTMPGDKNVQRHISHRIPGKAFLGIYTYRSRIGRPPHQLLDEDSFQFMVVME
jgi:hypothetical protein